MGKFFVVSFLVAVFTFAGQGAFAPAVYAETERYDFPPLRTKQAPKLSAEAWAKQYDVKKQNEARRQTIAALLRRYNKKLSEDKALEYAVLIIQTSDKYQQDPFVITSMIVHESSARPDAVSRGGDYGLMQVRWRVHQKKIKTQFPHVTKAKDILDPKINVQLGTQIFSVYRNTAKGDVRGGLRYYTAGNEAHADKVFATIALLEKSYRERLNNS